MPLGYAKAPFATRSFFCSGSVLDGFKFMLPVIRWIWCQQNSACRRPNRKKYLSILVGTRASPSEVFNSSSPHKLTSPSATKIYFFQMERIVPPTQQFERLSILASQLLTTPDTDIHMRAEAVASSQATSQVVRWAIFSTTRQWLHSYNLNFNQINFFFISLAHPLTDLNRSAASVGSSSGNKNTLTIVDNRTGKSYEILVKNNTISAPELRKITFNGAELM